MKSVDVILDYRDYAAKTGYRKDLYKAVVQRYRINRILYPGSHIDIAPSFVAPEVIYVDNFKGAIRFFKDLEAIKDFVNENKEYDKECGIRFLGRDYNDQLDIEPFDLIISQYAGFVAQATKKYLKIGGTLLSNDNHGDANLARYDEDFEFIGVVLSDNKINEDDLHKYFQLPRGKPVNLAKVRETMKGPKYTLAPANYLFRKLK